MSSETPTSFDRVRARWIPVWVLVALIPASVAALSLPGGADSPWQDVFVIAVLTLTLGAWSLRQLVIAGVPLGRFLGPWPRGRDAWESLVLVVPLMPLALAGVWLLWWPLSYVIPTFVEEYVLKYQPPFIQAEAPLRTALTVFLVVIVAPVVEEVLFRGVLLHRFAHKWGLTRAIAVSSLIFGTLHADILGHAVFGAVLCLLYVRSGTLWLPIAIHALNNGLAVAASAIPFMADDGTYTLAEFRRQWYVGLLAGAFAIPLLYRMRHRFLPRAGATLPTFGP